MLSCKPFAAATTVLGNQHDVTLKVCSESIDRQKYSRVEYVFPYSISFSSHLALRRTSPKSLCLCSCALPQSRMLILQGDEAVEAGDHSRASQEFSESINITGFPDVVYMSLWLKLCQARLHLGHGAPAVEACSEASQRDPDSEDALISKVFGQAERHHTTSSSAVLANHCSA